MDPESLKAGLEISKQMLSETTLYQDALQPGAKQVGRALETVGKAVNVALAPLSAIVWGYEKICNHLEQKLEQKLANVPAEDIQTPKANVAVPIIEGMRNVSEDKNLQELYANLLANAMNKKYAHGVLPSFGEIVKNLTSDEAKILLLLTTPGKIFPIVQVRNAHLSKDNVVESWTIFYNHLSLLGKKANCEYPHQTPVYLENLSRLRLIDISYTEYYTSEGAYDELLNDSFTKELQAKIESVPNKKCEFAKGYTELSVFGKKFCEACKVNG